MKKRFIIAIDGPAASGKSTTARRLAKLLGYVYLDTGAMYRACALQAERTGTNIGKPEDVEEMLAELDIKVELEGEENVILLDGEDVSEAIRANSISKLASDISALPPVRHKMVDLQRKLGSRGGVILDGRDIGSYVFPKAEIKFFLTASPEERAKRRWLELHARGIKKAPAEVLSELETRDKNDASRALAPLVKTPDAIEIDTTGLTIEQQVDKLYHLILERMGKA